MRSPLDHHSATPEELRERILAERRSAAFLLLRDGDGRQLIVELDEEPDRITIGRRPASNVALTWDGEVSRLHAELERVGADWVLCDDGLSRNGTFVGSERVTRRRLADGDVIAIGETLIAYCAPAARSSSAPTVTTQRPRPALLITPAQRRVLVALCRPYREGTYAAPASNQQIADELVLTVDTVKGTLRALFESFGLEDLPQNQKRAALVQQALESGLVNRHEL